MKDLTYCIVDTRATAESISRKCSFAVQRCGILPIVTVIGEGTAEFLVVGDSAMAVGFIKALRLDSRHTRIFPLADRELQNIAICGFLSADPDDPGIGMDRTALERLAGPKRLKPSRKDLEILHAVTRVAVKRKSDDTSLRRHILSYSDGKFDDMSFGAMTAAVADWSRLHETDLMQLRRVSGLSWRVLYEITGGASRKTSR